jgi:hypothetical protein
MVVSRSIFGNLLGLKKECQSTHLLPQKKAKLEGLIIFRKELLHRVVRDTLRRLEFETAVHKYKVIQDDDEGRRYVVIIDLTNPRKSVGVGLPDMVDPQRLCQVAKAMCLDAEREHQILISGVYWQASRWQAEVAGSLLRSSGSVEENADNFLAKGGRSTARSVSSTEDSDDRCVYAAEYVPTVPVPLSLV